jgi:pyruvate/2-oxoglutarate dehydrogenase complex dihydrolipoamide acyltransferase (E2) component
MSELAKKARDGKLSPAEMSGASFTPIIDAPEEKDRLNCIHHLLNQIPYGEVDYQPIVLPPRERHEDYVRQPVSTRLVVPAVY